MSDSVNRLLLLSKDFGAVLGTFPKNEWHKHFAIQITISDTSFITETNNAIVKSCHCVLGSNVAHKISVPSNQVLLVLNVNPFSEFGLWLKSELGGKEMRRGNENLMNLLWEETQQLTNKKGYSANLEKILNDFLLNNEGYRTLETDPRILRCLRQLRQATNSPSAVQMANQLNISEGRFLHLFKKETGLTYRRMRLWFYLEKSFQYYNKVKSLTELAHLAGFSDSAHYSRTFKESFGVTPSLFFRNSRFIQG